MSDIQASVLASLKKVKTYPVEIPEWGCKIYLRRCTMEEVHRLMNIEEEKEKDVLASLRYILSFCCDEKGERAFDDAACDLITKESPNETMLPLVAKFRSINGMTVDDDDAKKN